METKTKEEVIEELENQEITSDGANFYLLVLILEKLEELTNFINNKKEV